MLAAQIALRFGAFMAKPFPRAGEVGKYVTVSRLGRPS